jgi:hypothetical protein
MSDEYLWDGSGAPDAEVERLEKLLARFRATTAAAEFEFPAAATSPMYTHSRRGQWWRIAAAAVPAGAAAESRPGIGPGAPYFEDSSERFREALETVNFDVENPQAQEDAFTILLAEARPRDAFTLMNLFRRVDADDRGRLYDRLAVLLPPPAGVTRQNAVDGDDMSAWWDKLGLGHVKKGLKGPPRIEE